MANYTKRADGRIQKKVKIDGKYKTVYAKTPTELKEKIEDLQKKYYTGQLKESSYNVSAWSDKWIKTYKKDKERATYDMYESSIRLHIKPAIGLIQLDKLKQTDIMDMLNKLDDKPRKQEMILLTIKQILESAIDNELISKNVARKIKLTKHKSKEKEIISDDVIKKLKQIDDTDAFMILFLIYTGLRREEIVPLTPKDVDLKNKTISVNKAVTFKHNKPILKSTKNNENRLIPIFDIIYDKLSTIIENKPKFVFSNASGEMMTEQSMKRKIEKVLNKINKLIDEENEKNEEKKEHIRFTYHQTRHTFITLLHKAGIDVKQAQAWSGHKDIRILLDIYTHLDEQTNAINVDKVNNFFSPKTNKISDTQIDTQINVKNV